MKIHLRTLHALHRFARVYCTLAYYRSEWFNCMDIFLTAFDITIFDYLSNLQIKWLTHYRNCIPWNISEIWCSKHNPPIDKKRCALLGILYSPLQFGTTVFKRLHPVVEQFSITTLSTFWLQVSQGWTPRWIQRMGERSQYLLPWFTPSRNIASCLSLYQRPKLSGGIILQVLHSPFRPVGVTYVHCVRPTMFHHCFYKKPA